MINSSNKSSLTMMTPMLPAAAAASTPTAANQASAPIPIAAAEMPIGTTTTITTPPAAAIRIEKPERNLWREQEMLAVLQIIREKKLLPLLNDKTVRSEAVFRKVEKEMFDRGFRKKNFQQIWTKWKFLKSTYMTSRRMHQIPKIIPLEVYESLDELLSIEFQNDGSMSSYDGGDYEDGGGGAMLSNGGLSAGGYDILMSASVSTAGSNDGYLPVISNVQGSVAAPLPLSTTPTNVLFNGSGGVGGSGRKYAAELNGVGAADGALMVGVRKNKLNKNGFRTSFKNEEDTNGFGMQHPIFGYRLGVVKDEPIDDEYETSNNTTGEAAASESFINDPTTDDLSNSQPFPEIKPELASPPASPTSSAESAVQEDGHLPLPVVPVIQTMDHHSSPDNDMSAGDDSLIDPEMPRLHRYTPPPYRPASTLQIDQQHPPPLKQIPFMKIHIPPKPHVNQQQQNLNNSKSFIPTSITNSQKIPVLTLRKRKKRLNIPDLSEGNQSPAPSSKQSKISDEDDSRESPPESTQIPFVTYGKAMRDMSASLRDIQREMIDDFFKQQMDLAKTEHEFQKQQDAMLLQCFENQTKLLLDGARRLFMNAGNNQQGIPSMESVGVFVSDD